MIAWALETLVATTLLMLLVLALRAPVRQHFGPHMAYALWVLPIARLALPPLPGDWQLTRLFASVTRQVAEAPGVVVGLMPPVSVPPEAALSAVNASFDIGSNHTSLAFVPPTAVANGPSLAMLLVGLWVLGALGFLAYHLIAHRRHCRALLSRARVDRTVAQGRVRVIETDAAHGPLAFGVFRKYVAFPRDFAERYDAQERDLALAHELSHHVRGDLLANWIALIVLALHWFNPVAWRAFRAFRADQEMACDALVLAGRAQALRHAYGRAIVKSAHGGAISAACHLHTINEVKGRLRMLSKTHTNSPLRIANGLAGITLLGVGALGLTASGTQAAERIKDKVVAVTGMTLDQDAAVPPVPPMPPMPPVPPVSPAAPAAPRSPAAPAAPAPSTAPDAPEMPERPEPPAPPAPGASHRQVYRYTETKDGKQIKKMVVVRTNGDRQVAELPDVAEIEAAIPLVRNGDCGKVGSDGTMVIHREARGRKILIICSDRIAALSANAANMAAQASLRGMNGARIGIDLARRSIQANRHLSEAARADAMKDLDDAMREIERDLRDKH